MRKFYLIVLLFLSLGLNFSFADQHQGNNYKSLLRAYNDLKTFYSEEYDSDNVLLEEIIKDRSSEISTRQFVDLQRKVLLSNPALDFEKILFVKRKSDPADLGLPQNWQGNSSLNPKDYNDVLCSLELKSGTTQKLFSASYPTFIGDVDLHFDAEKMLFSMADESGRWGVYELGFGELNPKLLPLITENEVYNYDACYLPDGIVVFCSTAPITGVPCVQGSSHITNLYLWKKDTDTIRRLTFEQDHNWCPTMLPNGRILYLRWEYTDLPHFASRILFHMNPDGTNQVEYYGSNSYWPNSLFYARPIPNSEGKFVGIVGGHHGVRRMGELVLFDSQKGKFEADGVIQRIPGWGKKVEPIIYDQLVDNSWPKFLHPFPLNEKCFLVSCQPSPKANWGIYLVDIFDNMLLLKEEPGFALFEPIPIKPTTRPPVIPDRVRLAENTSTMYISDIYQGEGLKGVPRNVVKKLRLISYNFAFYGIGGQQNRVGLDGPWDVKEILGTVLVETDGSAFFTVPANTPISIQPLDENNCSVALMRSWTTAMPGEKQSCVGCHETQSNGVVNTTSMASQKDPCSIIPWYGPRRGFSFKREVQPVLNAYCIQCHNASAEIPDFATTHEVHPEAINDGYRNGTQFSLSYLALRKFVRTPSIESDMHLLPAYEFHANTTRLVQVLTTGHYGVELDLESWDRIVTWIDLNAPYHGTWTEMVGPAKTDSFRDLRQALNQKYANLDYDPEAVPQINVEIKSIKAHGLTQSPKAISQFLIDPDENNIANKLVLQLADDISLQLKRIPGGQITNLNTGEFADFNNGFWMGQFEVTNEQFAQFDPDHDSRLEHGDFLQFSEEGRGWALNKANQPVVRISWERAMEFCSWLSERSGKQVTLPTREQWQFALETNNPEWKDSFALHANLADESLSNLDSYEFDHPYIVLQPWRPSIRSVNDGFRVSAPVGSYLPNQLGLFDMIGNVAEWTLSENQKIKSAVGGSWYDRPQVALETNSPKYYPWQGVYNVGFRVVVLD